MFWNEKTRGGLVNGDIPMRFLPTPPKKEIQLMRELLRDIEKYDNTNDIEVRNVLLTALSEQIEVFKTKSVSKIEPTNEDFVNCIKEDFDIGCFKAYGKIEYETTGIVSISQADLDNGSPKIGDMIARNPKNHNDQWLVAEQYFKDNFKEINNG